MGVFFVWPAPTATGRVYDAGLVNAVELTLAMKATMWQGGVTKPIESSHTGGLRMLSSSCF